LCAQPLIIEGFGKTACVCTVSANELPPGMAWSSAVRGCPLSTGLCESGINQKRRYQRARQSLPFESLSEKAEGRSCNSGPPGSQRWLPEVDQGPRSGPPPRSVPHRRFCGNALPACIGVEIAPAVDTSRDVTKTVGALSRARRLRYVDWACHRIMGNGCLKTESA
jgi:hypothetical protein